MGTYLNPGNSGFAEILKSEYVDKTELIGLINRTIGTKKKLTCISRPRRYGKSYAAQMLCAYYDKTCDSQKLFNRYKISEENSYVNHMNQYDVIYWDMTGIKPYTENYKSLVSFLIRSITEELKQQYPSIIEEPALTEYTPSEMASFLKEAVRKSGISSMVVTMGELGAVYFDGKNKEAGIFPPCPTNVVDTSGAGDAFFSGTVMGLIRKFPLSKAVQYGARLASETISRTETSCPVNKGFFSV